MKSTLLLARLWLCFTCFSLWGQNETALHLNEVEVSDRYFQRFSKPAFVQSLADSARIRQSPSLATLLSTQTLVHLRENSAGMVASASIRGGNAAQTAVLWNGIPINSLLTGQSDLGILNTWDFSQIDVKSGGSSLFYGSGAISGSIHLQSDLNFNQDVQARFLSRYGSFQTLSNQAMISGGSRRLAYQFSAQALSSTNDYAIPGRGERMQNANVTQQSIQANVGWKPREQHQLSLFTYFVQAHRNLAVVPQIGMRSKLEDRQFRSVINYSIKSRFAVFHLKNAFLSEDFDYFENRFTSVRSGSGSQLFFQRWDVQKHFTYGTLSLLAEGQWQRASGDNFEGQYRRIGTLGAFWQSQNIGKWLLQTGVRREWNTVQDAPWVGNVSLGYAFTSTFQLFATTSTHYRLPTFNDLFWPGSGNPNLKPEFSRQYELGYSWERENLKWQTTVYHYQIDHQIRWIPTMGGLWMPENVMEVKNSGFETQFHYRFNIQKAQLHTQMGYTYVNAIDLSRQTRLTFVPEHKWIASATYARKRWDVGFNGSFTSFVFTTTDESAFLPSFMLFNVLASIKLDAKEKWRLHLNAYNLTNTFYETQINRPMPGRNLHIGLQYQL